MSPAVAAGRSLRWTLLKSLVFVVVTVLATVVLGATIRNAGGGGGADFKAVFTDVTSLHTGDDVRMAGVRIGEVQKIEVHDHRHALVDFSVDKTVPLDRTVTATIKFRNLVGQRYIALDQGTSGDPGDHLAPGSTLGLDRTRPALDLTVLFNGFQPLFQLLSPKDVNNLSYQLVQVFQGEGATVSQLVRSTASLTTTVAAKDEVIGELIDNLNRVLDTVNSRSGRFSQLIVTLQQLVSGLAADRTTIGTSIEGLGQLTTKVSGLFQEGRAPLKADIGALGRLSKNLSASAPLLDRFFATLPVKLDRIGRLASYGSWLNFYECSIQGRTPVPEGYVGDVGARPVAQRCR